MYLVNWVCCNFHRRNFKFSYQKKKTHQNFPFNFAIKSRLSNIQLFSHGFINKLCNVCQKSTQGKGKDEERHTSDNNYKPSMMMIKLKYIHHTRQTISIFFTIYTVCHLIYNFFYNLFNIHLVNRNSLSSPTLPY